MLEHSTANSSVRIEKDLAKCNHPTFTTKFWNLENDTSGSNVVRGKWQINDYIKTYVKLERNAIMVSFSTNINSR